MCCQAVSDPALSEAGVRVRKGLHRQTTPRVATHAAYVSYVFEFPWPLNLILTLLFRLPIRLALQPAPDSLASDSYYAQLRAWYA